MPKQAQQAPANVEVFRRSKCSETALRVKLGATRTTLDEFYRLVFSDSLFMAGST